MSSHPAGMVIYPIENICYRTAYTSYPPGLILVCCNSIIPGGYDVFPCCTIKNNDLRGVYDPTVSKKTYFFKKVCLNPGQGFQNV